MTTARAAAAAAALKRADKAARKVLEAVDAQANQTTGQDIAHALPQLIRDHADDHKKQVANALRTARELQNLGCFLAERQRHERHLESMDECLARIASTRRTMAALWQDAITSPPSPLGSDTTTVPAPRSRHLLSNTRVSKHCLISDEHPPKEAESSASVSRSQVTSVRNPTVDLASSSQEFEPLALSDVKTRAENVRRSRMPVVIEMRPSPCSDTRAGSDCACCLAPMCKGESTLAFPCRVRHTFHTNCLQRWLRKAGPAATCPMCRSLPTNKQSHPKS